MIIVKKIKTCLITSPLLMLYTKIIVITYAFCMISSVAFGFGLINGLAYAFYHVVFTLLPGLMILLLVRPRLSSNVEWFAFSYLISYASGILFYVVIMSLHILDYIPVFLLYFIVLAIAVLIFLRRKKNPIECCRDLFGERVCIVFLLVCLTFEFFIMSGNNHLPYRFDHGDFLSADFIYWVGDNVELTKEFPPKDFRRWPNPYNYHYFSSITVALSSLLTNVRPIVISCYLYYIQPILLYVFGCYILLKRICQKKIIIPAMIIILFSTGVERVSIVFNNPHRFDCPFGSDFGFALLLFAIYLLFEIAESESPMYKMGFVFGVLLALLEGTKGPFAVVALCILGLLCLIRCIRKKEILFPVITLGFSLICFTIVFLFVVNPSGYSTATSSGEGWIKDLIRETMNSNHSAMISFGPMGSVHDSLRAAFPDLSGYSKVISECLFILFFYYISNPIAATLTVVFSCTLKKSLFKTMNICLLVTIVSFLFFSVYVTGVGGGGMSMMYFVECVTWISLVYVFYNSSELMHLWKWFYVTAIIALVFFGTGSSEVVWQRDGQMRFYDYGHLLVNGIEVVFTGEESYDHSESVLYCTSKQQECYEYLRLLNTEGERVLMVDSRNDKIFKQEFLVGVVSEQYVLYDQDLMKAWDGGKSDELYEKMKSNRIKYMVLDTDLYGEEDLGRYYKMVFLNEEKTILEII